MTIRYVKNLLEAGLYVTVSGVSADGETAVLQVCKCNSLVPSVEHHWVWQSTSVGQEQENRLRCRGAR